MGLFGKKKEESEKEEFLEEELETEEVELDEEDAVEEENEDEDKNVVASPEDKFRAKSIALCNAIRMMFPQQMDTGCYYAELQQDGYIDDYCCYATNGELLEKDEIPQRLNMNDAEHISREEKLEQAFFLFRRAAVEFTEKPCNGVSVILMPDGQAKIDIVFQDLVEGEEDERYAKFRRTVEALHPSHRAPKLDEKTLEAIRDKTHDIYQAMGQSFYNFIPGNDFKVAFFYSEFSERGVFYYYRCVLNDGTILDKEQIFEHFGVDIAETDERRNEIVKNAFAFRQAFIDEKARPFSAISLAITGDGKFNTNLSYAPTNEEGEQDRLEAWKAQNTGEAYEPVNRTKAESLEQKMANEADPELQAQVNSIYMELGSEFFSYLPETEFHRSYFLCEFSDDGVFTYQRMVLKDGSVVEGDDLFEKFNMDVTEAENNRTQIIEYINNIRDIIINEGEKPFTAMTLAISDKGEFRSYMSFEPADPEGRDERLEAWKSQYNGGETIG